MADRTPFGAEPHDPQPAVVAEAVGIQRDGRWLLRGVTLSLRAGDVLGVLGPSGCGKSTLLRVIGGYEFPTTGEVRLLGQQLGAFPVQELRKFVRIAGAPGQHDLDPDLTVAAAIQTGFPGTTGLYEAPTDAEAAAVHDAAAWAGLTNVLKSQLSVLSSGELCRVKLARARVGEVRLLLLDEPTTGLDIVRRHEVHQMLAALSAHADAPAVVWVTHHPEDLPPGTSTVLLMADGTTVDIGPPERVLNDEAVSRTYGRPIRVVPGTESVGQGRAGWRFELR